MSSSSSITWPFKSPPYHPSGTIQPCVTDYDCSENTACYLNTSIWIAPESSRPNTSFCSCLNYWGGLTGSNCDMASTSTYLLMTAHVVEIFFGIVVGGIGISDLARILLHALYSPPSAIRWRKVKSFRFVAALASSIGSILFIVYALLDMVTIRCFDFTIGNHKQRCQLTASLFIVLLGFITMCYALTSTAHSYSNVRHRAMNAEAHRHQRLEYGFAIIIFICSLICLVLLAIAAQGLDVRVVFALSGIIVPWALGVYSIFIFESLQFRKLLRSTVQTSSPIKANNINNNNPVIIAPIISETLIKEMRRLQRLLFFISLGLACLMGGGIPLFAYFIINPDVTTWFRDSPDTYTSQYNLVAYGAEIAECGIMVTSGSIILYNSDNPWLREVLSTELTYYFKIIMNRIRQQCCNCGKQKHHHHMVGGIVVGNAHNTSTGVSDHHPQNNNQEPNRNSGNGDEVSGGGPSNELYIHRLLGQTKKKITYPSTSPTGLETEIDDANNSVNNNTNKPHELVQISNAEESKLLAFGEGFDPEDNKGVQWARIDEKG
jgi:hypothetical protein